MSKILVIGSMNMDIVTRVNRHPLPGETIHGLETSFFSGGKGANQAVAAARSGATVTMAGALGEDFFGKEIREILLKDSIDLKYVKNKNQTTGMALITIDVLGENNIILNKGTNGLLTEEDLAEIDWLQYDAILMQNEIPWETNAYILEKMNEFKIKTIFNPAPALPINNQYLQMIDLLILNELEVAEITEMAVEAEEDALRAAQILIKRGVSEVIITLGKKGAIYMNKTGTYYKSSAFDVQAVDTTAAGDTFIGAFVTSYLSNDDVVTSLRYAAAAAAIAVTLEGAQNSIPYSNQVNTFIEKKKYSEFTTI
ncbi:ribokinase [Peribacillus loiseleuriae]|uniref:Ribokinase n=1 Tax=Peribacillus loiseleuriae TaxID=1679170 RepID=A0A0K9GPU6_9BACI|nr:ribokinase [Peribacillus loiseleuriae]KMY48663.1 hypothetical protein AC625_03350 [Peribacillus loiseleuriae]